VGIFELYRLREADTDLILRHADEHTLRRHIRRHGMLSMIQDALAKAGEGTTSLAEIQVMGGVGFYASSPPVPDLTSKESAPPPTS
jgi:type II secretory ATPase GspE/PulE/Tfp pilus assembly ATPase PilB-like protein